MVAVERANGGELAPLLQVLWTLHSFTPPGSRPSPAAFAASTTLLVELGVVEYVDDQLGLTPEGRKLLRRSGMPNDAAARGARHRAASGGSVRRTSNPTDRQSRRPRRTFAKPSATETASKRPRAAPGHRSSARTPRSTRQSSVSFLPASITGVTLGAGSPAQGRGLRPGTARVRPVDGVAGASLPRPLVRPAATRSQRARGRRRRLSWATRAVASRTLPGRWLVGRLPGRWLVGRLPGRWLTKPWLGR